MLKTEFKNKIFDYIIFAINSIMFGFTYILFQRNYFSAGGASEKMFSPIRFLIFAGISICVFLVFFICSLEKNQKKYEKFILKVGTHPMLTVLNVSLLFRIWYLSHFSNYVIYYDTKTYITYPFNIFLGETDMFRTPGYPYFLKAIHLFTGNMENNIRFYETLSLVQSLLSFISILILYFAGRKLFSNKYILSFACLIYGIAPSIFNWDIIVLTESLSLFCTVVLIYIVFSYLAKPRTLTAVILGLYSFIMIMIRPTFVYLFAVLGVFFIARFIFNCKERKKVLAGMLSIIMSISLFFGYCGLNYKNYGYFKVSSVSNTVNNLCILLTHDAVENEDFPEISEHLKDEMEFFEGKNWITNIIEPLPDYFSYKEIDEYVTDTIDKYKAQYMRYTITKFRDIMNANVGTQYLVIPDEDSWFGNFSISFTKYSMPFTFLHCFGLVAIGVIFSLIVLIKQKRICWQILGLCALIFSHIFVSVYGSMAEYSRLSTMVLPAVVLLVFWFVDYVLKAIKKRKILCLDDANSTLIEIKREEK